MSDRSDQKPATLTAPPAGYAEWLAEVKARVHAAQQRAALALGCRLDVVAVHRLDGIAHWLSDDHVGDRLPPAGGAS